MQIPIIYRDSDIVVVEKPAGMLVHRSDIDRHETHFLVQKLRQQLDAYIYPVHRLDKATSGIMVFALQQAAASQLARSWRDGEVGKEYLAVVRGRVEAPGTVDHALKPRKRDLFDSRKPVAADSLALPAITRYEPLASAEVDVPVGRYATSRYSMLALYPDTGRRHQLRRHMKHLFHPIIGDTSYGDGKHNRWFREALDSHRLLLMSRRLSFRHPESGAAVSFSCTPDPGFAAVLHYFGWSETLCDTAPR